MSHEEFEHDIAVFLDDYMDTCDDAEREAAIECVQQLIDGYKK
jgi:hypothetical protein